MSVCCLDHISSRAWNHLPLWRLCSQARTHGTCPETVSESAAVGKSRSRLMCRRRRFHPLAPEQDKLPMGPSCSPESRCRAVLHTTALLGTLPCPSLLTHPCLLGWEYLYQRGKKEKREPALPESLICEFIKRAHPTTDGVLRAHGRNMAPWAESGQALPQLSCA